jgi:hypothetical protein
MKKVHFLVLSGDTVEHKHSHELDGEKFLFMVVGDDVFYIDTSVGKLWHTDKLTCQNLGVGHTEVIGGL